MPHRFEVRFRDGPAAGSSYTVSAEPQQTLYVGGREYVRVSNGDPFDRGRLVCEYVVMGLFDAA